jgi:predicted nucleic acid-binding protein
VILLDTNVLSALMRPQPDAQVIHWLDRQPRTSVWTSAITVFEIRFGLQVMATGKRRNALIASFELLLSDLLERRIAHFDSAAAHQAADLMAKRQIEGRSGELRDTMIAGIALATRATLATRNVQHFADIASTVVDPWNSEPIDPEPKAL